MAASFTITRCSALTFWLWLGRSAQGRSPVARTNHYVSAVLRGGRQLIEGRYPIRIAPEMADGSGAANLPSQRYRRSGQSFIRTAAASRSR
jgi:hypothetical protein